MNQFLAANRAIADLVRSEPNTHTIRSAVDIVHERTGLPEALLRDELNKMLRAAQLERVRRKLATRESHAHMHPPDAD